MRQRNSFKFWGAWFQLKDRRFRNSLAVQWLGLGTFTEVESGGSLASVPGKSRHCCRFLVTKSCSTLCDPMDCSPPDSSVHGISQARILEWVATSFSRGSSRLRHQTRVSCKSPLAGGFLTTEPPGKPKIPQALPPRESGFKSQSGFCPGLNSINSSPNLSCKVSLVCHAFYIVSILCLTRFNTTIRLCACTWKTCFSLWNLVTSFFPPIVLKFPANVTWHGLIFI